MIRHCECAFWRRSPITWTMPLIWPADWKHSILWILWDEKQRRANQDSYVPRLAGRNPPPGSCEMKLSEEVLKQLADLKGLVCSYRRDLEKQQQEIEGLKRSHQPPYQGNWNPRSQPHPAGAVWPGASSSCPKLAQVPRESSVGQDCDLARNGGGYRARSGS